MNKIIAAKPKEDSTDQTQQLKIIEGKQNILSGYSGYLQDESKLSAGEIEYIAFPNSEKQVVQFLKFASERNIPVTISNGRTGVVGGAVPQSGALMSLEQMNKILEIKKVCGRDEWHIVAEPGIMLGDLHKKVEMKDFSELKNLPEEFLSLKETYFYPVDVTETTARLGGTVSTNASGERSFRYGRTRNWVRRLRIVLSNGDVLDIKRGEIFADNSGSFIVEFTDGTIQTVKIPTYKMPAVKNAAGYFTKPNMDLIDLFIGSEGTLGVITEIEVALTKKPENVLSLMAFFPKEQDAIKFFFQAKRQFDCAIVFEYFDSGALEILNRKRLRDGTTSVVPIFPESSSGAIFFELEFTEENFENISLEIEKLLNENNSSIENTFGGFDSEGMQKIRSIRHALPEAINETIATRKRSYPTIHKISADIAVPEDKLLDMIDYYKSKIEPLKLEWTIFGHIGESHLHMNILPRDKMEFVKAKELHLDFAYKAVELGGTISAEHGIGKIKHKYLEVMYGIEGLKQMSAVKKSLDTKCILNRGNIFPEEYLF